MTRTAHNLLLAGRHEESIAEDLRALAFLDQAGVPGLLAEKFRLGLFGGLVQTPVKAVEATLALEPTLSGEPQGHVWHRRPELD
ncbi:hypothetical protein AB0A76_29460 [Streptomyces exfoliatus]|uniref:Uncharacterized protein n=1 Tax=Streptomyces exfoliatus TaxID=1905 RepID=A0ABV3D5S7_STREX